MIDNNIILKIEKALGFNLYPNVIKYLNEDIEWIWEGRKKGKTTAYILKLLLQKHKIIYFNDIGQKYIDEIHNRNYPSFFKHEFIRIRKLLVLAGIHVAEIQHSKGVRQARITITEKSKLIDQISDLIREYWINTGMKDNEVRRLADKLQDMADKIQIEEYEYQVNNEGIELFRTYWLDMFGELSEEFWKRYREDKRKLNQY